MSILSWIIVGFLAGGLARMATGSKKRGCIGTAVIGIVGALIGGAIFNAATEKQDHFTHLGIGSIAVAFIGACVLLLILQLFDRSSRASRRR